MEKLVLQPPNLKIWAERSYNIEHGLTAGDQRNYLIGAEGAGLTSDNMIQVYTEWLDHSGGPLPEGLGTDNGADYGLTGRLAKVVSAGQLEAVNDSGLANFSIAPGRQVQVIQIGDNLARAEHYYIHVSGKPKNETPQFDPGTDENDLLTTRPGLLTPFKTPAVR